MPLTNAGRDLLAKAINEESITGFGAAHAYLGVGDGTVAFSPSQTDLVASTNLLRKTMDATFPTRSGNVLTYQATFGSSEANFSWQEIGLFNGASSGTMFNRKVSNQGSKTFGQSWVLTLVNTIQNP